MTGSRVAQCQTPLALCALHKTRDRPLASGFKHDVINDMSEEQRKAGMAKLEATSAGKAKRRAADICIYYMLLYVGTSCKTFNVK